MSNTATLTAAPVLTQSKALRALDEAIDERAELLDRHQALHAQYLLEIEERLDVLDKELKDKLFFAVRALKPNEAGTRERKTRKGNRLLHLFYTKTVVSADVVEASLSKGLWYRVSTRVLDLPSYKAAVKLGQIPDEVRDLAESEKPVAPSLREG